MHACIHRYNDDGDHQRRRHTVNSAIGGANRSRMAVHMGHSGAGAILMQKGSGRSQSVEPTEHMLWSALADK